MAKNRLKFKLFLVLFLIVCHISGQYVSAEEDDDSDDEEEHTEKILKASAEEVEASEAPKGSKSDGKSDGKVMKMVSDTIHEVNPIRLIKQINPDPLLQITGLDIHKLKAPAGYFPDFFMDRFSKKTKMSKQEMSKEFGGDIEKKGEKDWVSIGAILKVGKSKNLRIGDYCEFFGIDLDSYEKQYNDYLIGFIRKPVLLIDDLLNGGFKRYTDQFKAYIKDNGGYMNSAVTAYDQYAHTNYTKQITQAIDKAKKFNATEEKERLEKEWKEYQIQKDKEAKKLYKDTFGKGGTVFQLQTKALKTFDSFVNFLKSIGNGNLFNAYLDLVGNAIGPTGRAIVYIVYQPSVTMLNQIFGPLILIPRILARDEGMYAKLLALPPVIIQTSSGLFKPVLMVFEPLLRLVRFLHTSQYYNSLSAGLDIAAGYGISIWGGAYKPKKRTKSSKKTSNSSKKTSSKKKSSAKKRSKRDTDSDKESDKETDKEKDNDKEEEKKSEKDKKSKPEKLDPKAIASDQKLADSYQGGPPPKGYKLGVKSNGTVDLDDEDIIARILLAPDFILKAGGPVFVPFASVLAPLLRALNTVIFGKEELMVRMKEVPDIIRGVGLIGPLADVIEAALPFIKTGIMTKNGQLGPSDLVIQTPNLVKHATSGVLYQVYKHPERLTNAMLSFLEGHGGIIAMLKLQANGIPPRTDPGAAESAQQEMKGQADFIIRAFGEFTGGWFLTYIQGVGPIGSMNSAFFNGIIGNIVDPVKYLSTKPNLKNQPLKNILNSFDDLPKMLKSSSDRKAFLTAVLGGSDPDVLNAIGINSEKLAANGIDPALLIGAGKHLLSSAAQKKLGKESALAGLGIKAKSLSKVNINIKAFLENGLLSADDKKLKETGINMDAIFNRIMRNSIEDHEKVLEAGIDIKVMLKAGIDPAILLAGGVLALPESKVKELGISNMLSMSDEDMKKLGLNSKKLESKGIDAKKLTKSGISDQKKAEIGINVKILMRSVFTGLEPKTMSKAGIDLKAMVSAGIDTKMLLTGGIKKELKNKLTEQSLSKIGIDLKQIMAMGININLLTDAGAAILNPMNLIKMGVDPMRVMFGTLSRSGLDSLTGDPENARSVSIEFVGSVIKIIQNLVKLTPRLREIPFIGPRLISADGRWKGTAGIIMYKIIGIEGGGLIEVSKKLVNGTLTTEDIKTLLALPPQPRKPKTTKKRREKADRKPVDEYVKDSMNLNIGPRSTPKPMFGSKLFKKSSGNSTEEESGSTSNIKKLGRKLG